MEHLIRCSKEIDNKSYEINAIGCKLIK